MKKAGTILLTIIIIVFNLIIGTNEKELEVLPIGILMLGIILYLIILKIKNNNINIILKTKIDIFILLFITVTMFPLIFKTYASFSDTIEFIMKYFFIYSVYVLARNVITEQKSKEQVISVTLICSLIPIILVTSFDYANAVAIYMQFCIFLAVYKIKNTNNQKIKLINIIYVLFASYIIIISKSKWVIINLLLIFFIMFIAKYKEWIRKNKKKVLVGICTFMAFTILIGVFVLNTSKEITKNNEDLEQIIKYKFQKDITYNIEFELTAENNEKESKKDNFNLQLLEGSKYFNENIIVYEKIENINGKYETKITPTRDTQYIRLKISNNCNGTIKLGQCFINGEKIIVNYKYIPNEVGYIFRGFLLNGQSLRQRIYMYQDSLKIAKDNILIGYGGNAWKNLHRCVQEFMYEAKEAHSYLLEILISYGIIGLVSFLVVVIYLFIKIFKQCKNSLQKRKDKFLITIGLFNIVLHSLLFDFDMSFMLIQITVYIYIALLLYDEKGIFRCRKIKYAESIIIAFLMVISSLYIRSTISKYLVQDNNLKHIIASYNKQYYYETIKEKNDVLKQDAENYKEILNNIKDYIDKEPYHYQTESIKMYFETINKFINKLSNEELKEYLDFGISKLQTIKFKTPKYIATIISRTRTIVDIIKGYKRYIDYNTKKLESQKQANGVNYKKIQILENANEELKEILKAEYEVNIENITNIEKNGSSKTNAIETENQYKKLVNTVIEGINE